MTPYTQAIKIGATVMRTIAWPPPVTAFCCAYIDPSIEVQKGQEKAASEYPLLIVPQTVRDIDYQWRNTVRGMNPNNIMLAYFNIHHETQVPGPGHDALRALGDTCWVKGADGNAVVVPNLGRVFDYRKPEWQTSFIAACYAILASWPYDGLFLDNCTVFGAAHPDPIVRNELLYELRQVLLQLRSLYPYAIIIGNSHHDFCCLNGEMCEGRSQDVLNEAKPFAGHFIPEINMVLSNVASDTDARITQERSVAYGVRAWYGACVTGQKVIPIGSIK